MKKKKGITRLPRSWGCCKIEWDSAPKEPSTVASHPLSYYFHSINFISMSGGGKAGRCGWGILENYKFFIKTFKIKFWINWHDYSWS